MTYRELLKLYQEGKLDKAQTDEVEHAIEKQEAISEYLYEKEEIPGLEVLQGQEKEEVFVQGNGGDFIWRKIYNRQRQAKAWEADAL